MRPAKFDLLITDQSIKLNIKAFCMKPVSLDEFSRVIPQVLNSAIKTRRG